MKRISRTDYRTRRHMRLRQQVIGTAERPRMSVCCSNKHIYVQFVDDGEARTLAATSTLDERMGEARGTANMDAAKKLGGIAASVAKDQGIGQVVFDRGGRRFHGRIKALADEARAGGLAF